MLREKLNEAMKTAMKARDSMTLETIRMMLARLKDKDIEARSSGNMDGIGEDAILSMLQTMIRQRQESVTMYQQGNRPELAAKEEAEIAVITRFLPQQLDDEAARAAIAALVAECNATSIKDMGRVMAELKLRLAGQIDSGKASALVKEALSA